MSAIKTKEKHKQYSVDFKLTAVQLSNHPNIQTQDVAVALGIHPFMLSRWKKEYREGKYAGCQPKENKAMEAKVVEQKEIRELERHIKKLELENALLKKSMPPSFEPN